MDVLRGSTGNLPALLRSFSSHMAAGKVILIVVALVGLVLLFSVFSTYASNVVLPGVSVAGVNLSGLDEADAVAALREAWSQKTLILRDGERTWQAVPAELGIQLDAVASARRALHYGREQGGLNAMITAALSGVDLEPVVEYDEGIARGGLMQYARLVEIPARNATLQLQGVIATHIDAQNGRRLNVTAVWVGLSINPAAAIADGTIDLPMQVVPPAVTDATPLVDFAQTLLQNPLVIEAYDPVSDQEYPFVVPPEEWGQWLDTTLVYHATGPRLYLSVKAPPVREYLEQQAAMLPEPLTLDIGDGVQAVQQAVATGSLNTWVTVHYLPTVYTVQRGETAYSISRASGIPFHLIEQANPDRNLSELYVGDQIALPSRDIMLPLPVVRGKRIVVDLSEQHMWAYENGQVRYEWPISSGIDSAPTSSGVFQVLNHDDRAYGSGFALCEEETCGQWVMHWFMGIYEIVPGLMNGFHGAVELPNGTYLGGGQVGRPFTYGCIMATEENAIQLYNWAEDGVVVEIRP
jgi:LysM repeat protein